MTELPPHLAEKVREIVSALFNFPLDRITESTSYGDVEAWDSIGHLNLVLALQEEFSVHVPPEDFDKLSNISAIVNYVTASMSKQR
jgi:acyl carrier protein